MKNNRLFTLLALMMFFAAGCTKPVEPNNGGDNNGGDNGGGNNGGGTTPVMESVDLGLPSGTLWATCNVGADTPEGYGDYFAWGETTPKDTYNWITYLHCNGSFNQLTKYCNNSNLGYNGFVDNLTTLEPIDDAATANWGSGWRMPTQMEWQELYDNTNGTWHTRNGVKGWLLTATNGNSLFLPAAGCRWGDQHLSNGSYGEYWSSSFFDLVLQHRSSDRLLPGQQRPFLRFLCPCGAFRKVIAAQSYNLDKTKRVFWLLEQGLLKSNVRLVVVE